MILLPVDEARGFDELSIATLKVLTSSTACEGYNLVMEAVCRQIGAAKVDEIVESPEYAELHRLNGLVFAAINRLAAEGEHPGDYTAMNGPKGLNHQRWLAKAALQKRFFPTAPLTERKVGYRKDET